MEFENEKKTLIFCVCGKAGSGKSLVGKYIQEEYIKKNKKVIISPYTKYLKKYIEEITGKKITEKNKPRTLLQKLSSKLIKEKLGYKNLFINRQIEDISIYKYFFDVIIIPDVRFPNEIENLKDKFKNVISICVKRKNYDNGLTKQEKNDITETSLNNYHNFDYILDNQGNKTLKNDIINIIEIIEKRKNKNE